MQSTLFEPTNLPQLETAGPLSQALFEEPFIAMAGVGLLGVLLLLALKARGKAMHGLVAFGVSILITAGLLITSKLVTTDREAMSIRAADLVNAVAAGDQQAMESLLAGEVSVQTRFASASGRDKVVALASSRVPRLVEDHSVPEVRADLAGPRVGRTLVKVRAQGQTMPTTSSWWMIHWQRPEDTSSDWVATYIKSIWIQGVSDPSG